MTYAWIPSPNFDAGRPGPIKWVVWHDTEGEETNGSAMGVARNWFGVTASQVSAHVVVDSLDVAECVKPENRAWHCGPRGNPLGYGIEIVGKAAQSVTDWHDPYSLAALAQAARWVLRVPVLAALPRRFLSDAELAAGNSGHITHAQVSRVLGGSTHTDPGLNFPFDTVTVLLTGATDMNWTDIAIPDYSKSPAVNLAADVTLGWMALHAGQAAGSAAQAASNAADAVRGAAVAAEGVATVGAKVDALSAKVDSLKVTGAVVDLDVLATKVADLLAARLAS